MTDVRSSSQAITVVYAGTPQAYVSGQAITVVYNVVPKTYVSSQAITVVYLPQDPLDQSWSDNFNQSDEFKIHIDYPYQLELINPGAETGDTTGWTDISTDAPKLVAVPTAALTSRTGSYSFGGGTAQYLSAYQDIAVPSQLESVVDTGSVYFDFKVWMRYYDTQNNYGKLALKFYNSSMTQLGVTLLNNREFGTANWVPHHVVGQAPTGTRYIRVYLLGENVGANGTSLQIYFDDCSLTAFIPAAMPLFNAGAEEGDASGWTSVLGTLITQDLSFIRRSGTYGFRSRDDAALHAYQDVSVPVEKIAEADAEQLTCYFIGYQRSYHGQDTGQFCLEFFNAVSESLGTAETSLATTIASADSTDPSAWRQRQVIAAVPAGTRTVRAAIKGVLEANPPHINLYWDDFELVLAAPTLAATFTNLEWEDTQTQSDTFNLVYERALEDTQTLTDNFTRTFEASLETTQTQSDEINVVYGITSTQTQTDTFNIVYQFTDDWAQSERYYPYRTDLWVLYQAVTAAIGTGNLNYDINDDGAVTPLDATIIDTHYWDQEIAKNLRTTAAWTDTFHTPLQHEAAFTNAWTQSSEFTTSLYRLGYTDHLDTVQLWNAPGVVEITLDNSFNQSDLFYPFKDLNTFNDTLEFTDIFDPSFPAKVRSWSDNFYQTDSFDCTGLVDDWVQTENWILGETKLFLEDTWIQVASVKPPTELTLDQTWNQTSTFITKTTTLAWQDAWTHTSTATATYQNSTWQDAWTQTDTFSPPTEINLPVTWTQSQEFRPSIHTTHLEDTWEQVSDHHSMTSQVGIWQLAIPMLSWFESTQEPLRHITDTLNWQENWRTELPTEDWEETQTHTDEFEANPAFEEQSDTWLPTEDWQQAAGVPYIDIFNQTQLFTVSHDNVALLFDDTQTWAERFSWYRTPSCPAVPRATFTLGDLVLRNPIWGNKITLEQARTIGASRSGTPFVGRREYWPNRVVYKYTIRKLTDEQFDDILDFMEENLGKLIWWTDHYGAQHRGFQLEPATPVRRRSRNRGEIELVLVDIGDLDYTFDNQQTLEGAFTYE